MKRGNSGERRRWDWKSGIHRISGCDVAKLTDWGQSLWRSEKESESKVIHGGLTNKDGWLDKQTEGERLTCGGSKRRKGSETEWRRMKISRRTFRPTAATDLQEWCQYRQGKTHYFVGEGSCTLREVWPLGKRSRPPTHAKFRGNQRGKSGFLGASICSKTCDIVAFANRQTINATSRRSRIHNRLTVVNNIDVNLARSQPKAFHVARSDINKTVCRNQRKGGNTETSADVDR